MKKNIYQIYTQISNDLFLYYNSFSNKYLLLNKRNHDLYQKNDADKLLIANSQLYYKLNDSGFIIENNVDEKNVVNFRRLSSIMDTSIYHIVINVTLDCNLHCWYCYEEKFKGSDLKNEVSSAIKKNIVEHYHSFPFSKLKISFFGGEPFLNTTAIQDILIFSKEFCQKKEIALIADFTTNATLIKEHDIHFLKDYLCTFQITLDGDKDKHNKVKYIKGIDTYKQTIKNIYRISSEIPNSKIWIRINFDAVTLEKIDEILAELDNLDRKRTFLILRKVWQKSPTDINTATLLTAIQKIFDKRFFVDCYALSLGRICFAERINQVLFNYDGKIFKCSTLPSFDEKNSMGVINLGTGKIQWDVNKISQIIKSVPNNKCDKCKLYPSCVGLCHKNLLKNIDLRCVYEEMNMNLQEFLMYNFKVNYLNEKV